MLEVEAAHPIKARGVGYVQASLDLGVRESVLRSWVKGFADYPQRALPGHGQVKREGIKLKPEWDILNWSRVRNRSSGSISGGNAAAYFAKEST